jgi:hypothetical protein
VKEPSRFHVLVVRLLSPSPLTAHLQIPRQLTPKRYCSSTESLYTSSSTTQPNTSSSHVFPRRHLHPPARRAVQQHHSRRINNLSDAEAIALLPQINNTLAREAAAWADHCASVQSKRYASIITQAYARGTDVETIKTMALHHILATLPARFTVLAKLNRCQSLEPLSEALSKLCNDVRRDRARGSAHFGTSHRRLVRDQAFADAISEQEAVLTDLENIRGNQLGQMRMMLLGARQLDFTSTKHVVAFVGMMEDLGIDTGGILAGESDQQA